MRAYGQCRIELPDRTDEMMGGDAGPMRWPVEHMDGSQSEFGVSGDES